jgi:UDP-N-acetylmuramoyl-L-alanyl-D-glutamate--2,6-diaminopimelate ligase
MAAAPRLAAILRSAGLRPAAADTAISGLGLDSRQASPGQLFCALPSASGRSRDAVAHVRQALARGAAAVLALPAVLKAVGPLGPAVALPSGDPRRESAKLAAAFHGHPALRLRLSGVTGTNGKTTIAHLLHGLLTGNGRRQGALLGTVGYRIGRRTIEAPNTTPSALQLQALFAQALQAGCRTAVMEVSSHALDQGRVEGLAYQAAVFSNLTRDHLDYHGSLAAYGKAKSRLFAQLRPDGVAVLNAEDPWSARMAAARTRGSRVLRYHAGGGRAELRAEDLVLGMDATRFTLCFGGRRLGLRLPLPGRFNVANALAAAGAALGQGMGLARVAAGLEQPLLPPGRFELLRQGQPFNVAVDYAHTPDALERLIRAARDVTPGRVITVFGCGGDRDCGKRPMMGALAAVLSDRAVLTSDNPRSEDPAAILRQVRAGIPREAAGKALQQGDRRRAIRLALGLARRGDSVLIAGKGHEDYQIVGRRKLHFDDRQEARQGLAGLGYRGGR